MSHICPSCGFNLSADQVIERDGFLVDPRGVIAFEGRVIRHLTPSMVGIVISVAGTHGRPISKEAVINRISDSDSNIVDVMLCRMRKIFAAQEIPFPIFTVRKRGFCWGLPG